jgi:competence protein ComGC
MKLREFLATEARTKNLAAKRRTGFTIIEVILLLLAIVVIALAVPNRDFTHRHSTVNACINNLRQIGAAKQQWALEKRITNLNATPTVSDIWPLLGRGANGALPYCPLDPKKSFTNSYIIRELGAEPQCRFTNRNPSHVLLH